MAEEQETGSTPVNMEQPSQDEVLTLSSSQEPNMATDVGDMSQDEVVELSSQEPEDAVDNSVYCQLGFAKIGRCDYLTLRTGVRLNDEVINGMLHYLSRDIDWCHCFRTRFMNRYLETTGENQQDHSMSLSERRYEGVRRWTRGINLMTKEVVLFPINSDDHWYLIAVTNLSGSQPSITVMNSLQNIGSVPEFVAAGGAGKSSQHYQAQNINSIRYLASQQSGQVTVYYQKNVICRNIICKNSTIFSVVINF